MELLIAILLALGVNIGSGKSTVQIQQENSTEYARAQTIISTNSYSIDESGVVIIDDGVGD